MNAPAPYSRIVQVLAFLALPLSSILPAATVDTSTQKSSDFESGSLAPFPMCTTQSPNYVEPATLNGANCAKFFWSEAAYNGTRMTRGAEACGDLNIYKDGWHAFQIYVPSGAFPGNKYTIIGQIFNEGGCSSWAGVFSIRNNELWIEHRGYCGTADEAMIAASVPRDRWVRFVCQFTVSHLSAGSIKVWFDGAPQASPSFAVSNINFGFGDWTGDTLTSTGDFGVPGSPTNNMIRLKVGMYCADTAHYTPGETRTLYYDNVVQLKGSPADAWNLCNGGAPVVYPAESAVVGGGTVIESTNGGYLGTGYANFSTTGGTLTFNNVNSGMGDSKTLVIRHALGAATARTGQLIVNGVATAITFAPTGAWNAWQDKNIVITLKPGTANTIQLKSTGQDFANIDQVKVQ